MKTSPITLINKIPSFVIATVVVLTIMVFDVMNLYAGRSGGRSFGGSRGSSGRSFGGSRGGGSFGGSRSRSTPAPSRPNGSNSGSGSSAFGSSRSSAPTSGARSWGGRQMDAGQARSSYGVPRKTQSYSQVDQSTGQRSNYTLNQFGGYGDGLMMGYMMGMRPWYWSLPMFPAFYYSAPAYVPSHNGSYQVYPPTFQWGTLFFTILLVVGIIFIVRMVMKSRRQRLRTGYSTFDDDNQSQSSFV